MPNSIRNGSLLTFLLVAFEESGKRGFSLRVARCSSLIGSVASIVRKVDSCKIPCFGEPPLEILCQSWVMGCQNTYLKLPTLSLINWSKGVNTEYKSSEALNIGLLGGIGVTFPNLQQFPNSGPVSPPVVFQSLIHFLDIQTLLVT